MQSLEQIITTAIATNADLPFREVVQILIENFKGPSTIFSPVEITNKTANKEKALSALAVLSKLGLIAPDWTFWSSEDEHYSLTSEEVQEALHEGVLIHPESGEEITDFWKSVSLLYKPTDLLGELLAQESKKKGPLAVQWRDPTTPLSQIHRLAYQSPSNPSPYDYARSFIIDLTQEAIPQMEKHAKNHSATLEDALTDTLYASMRAAYPVLHRESDSNGHVDLTLSLPLLPIDVLFGEAKVIDGKRHLEWYLLGLGKLITKYIRCRSKIGLLICYCRKEDSSHYIDEYTKNIVDNKAFGCIGRVSLDDHNMAHVDTGSTRITRHVVNGRNVDIVHAWVDLFVPTDETVDAQAKQIAKQVRIEKKAAKPASKPKTARKKNHS